MSRKRSDRSRPDPPGKSPDTGGEGAGSAGADAAAVGVLIGIWAVYFFPMLVSKDLLFGDDMISSYYILYDYVRRGFQTWGAPPLWAREVFCGNPLLPFVWGSLYPFNWIFLFVPAQIGFNLFLPLHNLLAALFAYALMRSLRIRPAPAVVGALAYQFTGRLVTLMQQPRLLAPTVYLPALALAAIWILRTGRWRWVLFGAAMLALQFLVVNPQITVYSGMIVGAWVIYGLVRLGREERSWRPVLDRTLKLAAGGALFLGLVAPQLAETAAYSRFSSRGAGKDWEFATSFSWPPEEIMSLFLKSPYGEWLNQKDFFAKPWKKDLYVYGRYGFTSHAEYLGVVTLFLASIGFLSGLRGGGGRRGPPVVFLLALAVGCYLFALGRYGPLFPVFFHLLPPLSRFRVPVRMLIGTELATAILAGAGADALWEALRRGERMPARLQRTVWISAGILAGIVMLFLLITHLGHEAFARFFRIPPVEFWHRPGLPVVVAQDVNRILGYLLRDVGEFLLVLAAACGAVFLAFRPRAPRRRTAILAVVPLLLIVDQGSMGRRFQHRIPLENRYFTGPKEVVAFLKSRPGLFRILPMVGITEFLPNLPYLVGLESFVGYHAVTLRHFGDLAERARYKPILDMANVEYLLLDADLSPESALEPVFRQGTIRVYRNPGALPRAYLVDRFRTIPDAERRLQYMTGPSFDPAREVVLEDAPPKPAPVPGEGGCGEVEPPVYGRETIRTRVNARRRCFLVTSDTWYPDWSVEVDGRPAEILRANHAFRAVVVDAGEHDVVFRYTPRGYRRWLPVAAGLWIALAVGLGAGFVGGRRRRRTGSR